MRRGYVFSDLHLFSRRSVAESYLDQIRQTASSADVLVLNGDIFDFRWSVLPSKEESVERAIQWMREFAASFPACRLHYILGNHDSLPQFREKLSALAIEKSNLTLYESHLKLGSHLFLHGDICDGGTTLEELRSYRKKFSELRPKGKLWNDAYMLIFHLGLQKTVYFLHPRKKLAEKIRTYLDSTDQRILENVTDIYFGHTHAAFERFQHDGLCYHNTGCALRGLAFRIVEFSYNESEA